MSTTRHPLTLLYARGPIVALLLLTWLCPAMAAGPQTLSIRMSDEHLLFASASNVRGLGADPAATRLSTKIGVQWQPAVSRFGLEQGAIGMQWDSRYRLSLRARHGGPMLFLRGRF